METKGESHKKRNQLFCSVFYGFIMDFTKFAENFSIPSNSKQFLTHNVYSQFNQSLAS